jgi:anti-sigma28 factor (negative regulator of flagellin synthesis)
MCLFIQSDPAAGLASTETSRTGQPAAAASGTGKARTASAGESGDHVEVSSVAESISAGISAQNLQHAARVTQLGALYASGQYTVDSGRVSSAIVGSAVTGTATGKA